MSMEEAKAIGMPMRLLSELRSLLQSYGGIASVGTDGGNQNGVGGGNGEGMALDADSVGQWHPDLLGVAGRTNKIGLKSDVTCGRVTQRKNGTHYRLKEKAFNDDLAEDMQDFFKFCTTRTFYRQTAPIRHCTAQKYMDLIRGMLGWMLLKKDAKKEDLRLSHLVPSAERDGARLVFEYIVWLEKERKCSPRTITLNSTSLLVLSHFLYHELSQANPGEGDKPYGDLGVVRELRRMVGQSREAQKGVGYVSDDEQKWLDWPDYLKAVEALREEFETSKHLGNVKRAAWSLQKYLLFAILACVPDRQRTLRELQEGVTLVESNGSWVIRHKAGDYKTGGSYGDRPDLVIAEEVGPYLQLWLEDYRAVFAPKHQFVFTNRHGGPVTDSWVHFNFSTTALRITGKRTNPHLVRDMVVTYLKAGDCSDKELEALAMYMGHSQAMQRTVYDRRTKAEKITPAVELLKRLNATW